MILIEDLGYAKLKHSSRQREHFAIYECPNCLQPFKARVVSVEKGGRKGCQKCANKKPFRDHKLYPVYCTMKARCYNKNTRSYKDYGGRGVVVCDEWLNDYEIFYTWATTHGYQDGLEIDRFENDGNYTPDNCWFTNDAINAQKRRLIRKTNTSGYAGVCFRKNRGTWSASITSFGKRTTISTHHDIHLAAVAYNNFVISHKTHPPLNPIPLEYQHLIIKPE